MKAALLCAFVALGCASEPSSTEPDGGWVLPESDASIPDTPAGHVAARFERCAGQESGCHGGGAAGLRFGDGPKQDLANVVGVRSSERPDLFRVEPGAPDRSWLYLKVSNARDAGVETAMPLGSDGDPAFAAEVRAWIVSGAPVDP